jgi:phosphoglycerol transferase MdoB-like AlkP superfamily enzyme
MLSFPNMPGFEYLMQNIVSNQPFASLPGVLKQNGYQTMFIYNGNLSWDNMEGFFRKQGIDRFIGGDDFVNPIKRDRVWGVTDQDVFDRANQEFAAAEKKGPFFSLVLTLSNHAPFDLPEPLPFGERTADMGDMNKRADGVRYADWCVGHFIDEAKKASWFDNTIFVFVGDHGFFVPPLLTEANITFHHVPLLFYAPKLFAANSPKVIHATASQLNIAPSVFGLLQLDTPHASWGRNLFSSDYPDENFAIFKGSGGSGSDQAVVMMRGDKLLVVDSLGQTKLWNIRLNPDPGVTPLRDDALLKQMQRELFGYVQAAMTDLTAQKAGPPK